MSNRVAILIDTNVFGYDQRNAALCSLTDYVHCFPYPQLPGVNGSVGNGNIAGYEGIPYFVECGGRIETATVNGVQPKLLSVTVSIRAIKTGKNDFVLESKTWNVANSCRLN